MYRIHRSIDISFSHHVRGHSGPCVNIHGHTWKFEVGLEAESLDDEGFVVDFGRLKREVLEPCFRLLDHSFAVGADTFEEIAASLVPVGERLIASREKIHGDRRFPDPESYTVGRATNRFPGGLKLAVFPFNPTSERLARWLFDVAAERLSDERVAVAFARIYETLHPVESVAEFVPNRS